MPYAKTYNDLLTTAERMLVAGVLQGCKPGETDADRMDGIIEWVEYYAHPDSDPELYGKEGHSARVPLWLAALNELLANGNQYRWYHEADQQSRYAPTYEDLRAQLEKHGHGDPGTAEQIAHASTVGGWCLYAGTDHEVYIIDLRAAEKIEEPLSDAFILSELAPYVCHGCGAPVVLDCADEDAPPVEEIFCPECAELPEED
jgi:hypothetical protein